MVISVFQWTIVQWIPILNKHFVNGLQSMGTPECFKSGDSIALYVDTREKMEYRAIGLTGVQTEREILSELARGSYESDQPGYTLVWGESNVDVVTERTIHQLTQFSVMELYDVEFTDPVFFGQCISRNRIRSLDHLSLGDVQLELIRAFSFPSVTEVTVTWGYERDEALEYMAELRRACPNVRKFTLRSVDMNRLDMGFWEVCVGEWSEMTDLVWEQDVVRTQNEPWTLTLRSLAVSWDVLDGLTKSQLEHLRRRVWRDRVMLPGYGGRARTLESFERILTFWSPTLLQLYIYAISDLVRGAGRERMLSVLYKILGWVRNGLVFPVNDPEEDDELHFDDSEEDAIVQELVRLYPINYARREALLRSDVIGSARFADVRQLMLKYLN
jgi:hypothetical protein